jgi:putative MATE family efflux protein
VARDVECGGDEAVQADDSSREHILADTDIGALLWRISIPATVGMAVMATYNLVDAIFIGRGVGTLGIAGLAICFPIQLIVMSIGQMIGMGGASIISRALGACDEARAHRTLGNVISLVILFAGLIMVLGFGFLDQMLRGFGASPEILPYARQYLSIILWGTAFRCYAMSHNSIIRSEGRAKVAMGTMLVGAIVNMILDPIFIFGLHWGMRGAAAATVIAQGCSTTYIVLYFATGRSSLSMALSDLRISLSIVRETLTIGAASFGRMVAGSVLMIVLNHSLGYYGGNLAIAAYGLINRLLSFFFMPIMGFSQALQPVAGFNYGARRFAMAKRAMRISIVRSSIFGTCAFVVIMIFARPFIRLFTGDADLIALTVPYLRIVVLAFSVVGFQVMGATMFQAFGRATEAIVLSLARQIIVLIPLVLILPRFFGLTGIFSSFPAADALSATITLVLFMRESARLDRKHAAEMAAG